MPFGFAGGYRDITGLIYMINRYHEPATGEFVSVVPLGNVSTSLYAYTDGEPVNGTDLLVLCAGFDPYCWYKDYIWETEVPKPVRTREAEDFLIVNGFKKAAAKEFVEAMSGQIFLTDVEFLQDPIYRYYSGSNKRGYFFTNKLYLNACSVQPGLHLRYLPSRVVQVQENLHFGDGVTSFSLVLKAGIKNGDAGALQYVVYDPNEFSYGRGVSVGQAPPSP